MVPFPLHVQRGLPCTLAEVIRQPGDLNERAQIAQDLGAQAITVHVGGGFETDHRLIRRATSPKMDRICEDIIALSDRLCFSDQHRNPPSNLYPRC